MDGRSSATTRSATRRSGAARCSCTRRSRARSTAASGPGVSPKTALAVGLKVDAARSRRGRARRSRRARSNLDDPDDDARAAQAQCGRRREGRSSTRNGHAELGGHHVRPVPLDGRRLVRAGHRQAARRLGEPRSERRRDRRARAEPPAASPTCSASTRRPCKKVLDELGPGQVRRRAVPGRQGVPARRQDRGDADPAGFRARRREPPHVHRLGLGDVLERLRRQPRDARPGELLRPAARRRRAVPGRGEGRLRGRACTRRPDHARSCRRCTSTSSSLPAPTPPKGSFDAGGGAARQGDLRRQGQVRELPRAADSSPSRAGTCTRRPRSASTTSRPTARPTHTLSHDAARGLFAHAKGGFYHDGRFATLGAVVDHYDSCLKLGLTTPQKNDLVEYLKSL